VAKPSGLDATWLRTLNLMRKHPSRTLLPLVVTQLPFAVATAVAFFYLFYKAYPTAEFETFDWLSEAPGGLRLTMFLLGGAQSLFSLVGGAATMIAVDALHRSKPLTLAQALDPAFTRMGGLLLLGVLLNALLIATFIGLIVFVYFIVRLGVMLQTYVLEQRSVAGAFTESWRLMRGRMFKFLAVLITAVPFAVGFLFVTSLVFGIVAAPFDSDSSRTAALAVQSAALFVVIASLIPVAAYLATSTTIFYLSAREAADA
jgi:hypothetical protein